MAQAIVSARASNEDRCERILQVYYDRLRDIDESVQDLTNFFFTVNALFIGLVVQFVHDDLQQLLLAVLGYFVSVAILCITYKGFLSWRLYREGMRPLEKSLGYDISEKYEKRLKGTPGEILRVTLVQLRFSFFVFGLLARRHHLFRLQAIRAVLLNFPMVQYPRGHCHLRASLLCSLGVFQRAGQTEGDLGRGTEDMGKRGVRKRVGELSHARS